MPILYCKLSPKEIIMDIDIDRYIDALKQGKFPKSSGSSKKIKLRKSHASKHNISVMLDFFTAKKALGKWKSMQTERNYIFNLHGLAEFLGDIKFEEVGKKEIIGYLDLLGRKVSYRTKRKLTPLTIEVAKSRLLALYRWLNGNELPKLLKCASL